MINQLDNKGLKHGIWVEKHDRSVIIGLTTYTNVIYYIYNYEHGLKQGRFERYDCQYDIEELDFF